MDLWGWRLANVLKARRITQRKIARALKVSPQAVSKWAAGGEIDHINLRNLAKMLRVNWVWLRYGADATKEAMESSVDEWIGLMAKEEAKIALSEDLKHLAACSVLNIGIWDVDMIKGERYMSRASRILLGGTDRADEDQNIRSWISDTDIVRFDNALRRSIHEENPFVVRCRIKHKQDRSVLVLGQVLKDNKGSPCRMIGVLLDGDLPYRYRE